MANLDVPILNVRNVARVCAWAAWGIAMVALAGWVLGIPILYRGYPHGPPALLGVSVAFLLGSTAVILQLRRDPPSLATRRLVRGLALTTLAVGLVSGSDHETWRRWLHDSLAEILPGTQGPGYDPKLRGGFAAMLFGIALLLVRSNRRWAKWVYVAFVVIPLLTALLALIGHVCHVPSFFGWLNSVPLKSVVSLPGAVAATLLGVALLGARPDLEVTRMLVSRGMGGYVARRLLLTPVLVPLLTGLLVALGSRGAPPNPEVSSWIFSFSNITVFTVLIAGISILLYRTDLKRLTAEAEVLALNDSLEQQVLARTDQLTETNLRLAREIEERKRTEEQLLRSQRVECLGALAGGIVHDLNNMLAPIQMSCELLKGMNVPREADPILDIVMRSTQRGSDLVKQILYFTRGSKAGRRALDLVPLLAELKRALDAMLPPAIALTVHHPDRVPAVLADPTQIFQVLMNLCINARDAMPSGGSIRIEVEADGTTEVGSGRMGAVRIRVRDSGTGIPPAHLERIFDPFFTTKKLGDGTGLGLATVRRIVEQHQGAIGVESVEGVGSTFIVSLPTAHGQTADPSLSAGTVPMGHGERILVIEDEGALRQILQITLENANYRVSLTANGLEALQRLEQEGPADAILTDHEMPKLGGHDLLGRLSVRWPDIPIICMSGASAREGAGITPRRRWILEKPFTTELLLLTLHRALLPGGEGRGEG